MSTSVLREVRKLKALKRRASELFLRPSLGAAKFGDWGRTSPISDNWGFDRGAPLDRHYIASFLCAHAGDL
jgi:hypothetical protein